MSGGGHNHSHDGGDDSHGHSHGGGEASNKLSVGFGDEDEVEQSNSENMQRKKQMMMMQQVMMQNAMKGANMTDGQQASSTTGTVDMSKMGVPINPMMMGMMPKMTPQQMEMAKKMFEQRQQMMTEYMKKQDNPEALQEMMVKAAEMQKAAMIQMKKAQPATDNATSDSLLPQETSIPGQSQSIPSTEPTNLLNANLNNSKLDELINPKGSSVKKVKNEKEAKILEAIGRKEYSELNAIKATQYGILERLQELVDSKQTDPHKPDSENVYLLHWAAINNRLEIAKYLISLNCAIDVIGGELESTPLNWASRSGHIQMVVYLLKNGANPLTYDVEGFSTIHLSTMFGHSIVTSYLLAKGLDPDMKDKNGVTPLMFAAQRIHSRDPAQLLITFNARMNVQDTKGNTPLHYCVAFNNATVMKILLDKGASLDVKNNKGMDPIEFAIDRNKGSAAGMMRLVKNDDRSDLSPFLRSIGKNKETRKFATRLYPFLLLFYFGILFESSLSIWLKIVLILSFYGVSFAFKTLFFDKDVLKYVPIATTVAFIFWSYVTYIINFASIVFTLDLMSLTFVFVTIMSWYNLYKAYKSDPGVISNNHEQMSQTIIKFVEQDEFSLEQFCTACIVRKPIRSKHCVDCDRCVSKFDHHCPWVDNCIGDKNLKYFIGFVFWTPMCLFYFIYCAWRYYQVHCYTTDIAMYPEMTSFRLFIQFLQCSPWVGMFTIIAFFNSFWISCLAICHIYQSVFIALTTNERMNITRYKHFEDSEGRYRNPFNFGVLQNCVDMMDTSFCFLKPTLINWKKEYDVQHIIDARMDKKKDKYQIV